QRVGVGAAVEVVDAEDDEAVAAGPAVGVGARVAGDDHGRDALRAGAGQLVVDACGDARDVAHLLGPGWNRRAVVGAALVRLRLRRLLDADGLPVADMRTVTPFSTTSPSSPLWPIQ